MNIAQFDYSLPENLIAQRPVEPRDAAKLMVVHRKSGEIEHRVFRDIIDYVVPADTLVINRTRVMPARLRGVRSGTGGNVEVILVREVSPSHWKALLKPAARLAKGTCIELEGGTLVATIEDGPGPSLRHLRFDKGVDVALTLSQVGSPPLPPYIRRAPVPSDRNRYQTVYADEDGAVAAPTAGLHFTGPLLDRIREQGTVVVPILLHVGPGTFQPIRTDVLADHTMDAEYYRVDSSAVETLQQRMHRGRVVAVGTTTVRTLETIASNGFEETPEPRIYEGNTKCFIYPPYDFRLVDVLLTNFHLPKSTLLLLVSAFAGKDLILAAYEEAVRKNYRFYSYGDAMLII